MAYTSGDLNLVAPAVGSGTGGSVWTYHEVATALATLVGANYLTDALDKGIKVGDIVIFAGLTGGAKSVLTVTASGATVG
jgi:hypothetical protein